MRFRQGNEGIGRFSDCPIPIRLPQKSSLYIEKPSAGCFFIARIVYQNHKNSPNTAFHGIRAVFFNVLSDGLQRPCHFHQIKAFKHVAFGDVVVAFNHQAALEAHADFFHIVFKAFER